MRDKGIKRLAARNLVLKKKWSKTSQTEKDALEAVAKEPLFIFLIIVLSLSKMIRKGQIKKTKFCDQVNS